MLSIEHIYTVAILAQVILIISDKLPNVLVIMSDNKKMQPRRAVAQGDCEISGYAESPENTEIPENGDIPGYAEAPGDAEVLGGFETSENTETPVNIEATESAEVLGNTESLGSAEVLGNTESPESTEVLGNTEAPESDEVLGNTEATQCEGTQLVGGNITVDSQINELDLEMLEWNNFVIGWNLSGLSKNHHQEPQQEPQQGPQQEPQQEPLQEPLQEPIQEQYQVSHQVSHQVLQQENKQLTFKQKQQWSQHGQLLSQNKYQWSQNESSLKVPHQWQSQHWSRKKSSHQYPSHQYPSQQWSSHQYPSQQWSSHQWSSHQWSSHQSMLTYSECLEKIAASEKKVGMKGFWTKTSKNPLHWNLDEVIHACNSVLNSATWAYTHKDGDIEPRQRRFLVYFMEFLNSINENSERLTNHDKTIILMYLDTIKDDLMKVRDLALDKKWIYGKVRKVT